MRTNDAEFLLEVNGMCEAVNTNNYIFPEFYFHLKLRKIERRGIRRHGHLLKFSLQNNHIPDSPSSFSKHDMT